MKTLRLLVLFTILLYARVAPALAEEVVEAWRGGGFSYPRYVAVNPNDDSCWLADGISGQLVHLAQDGSEVWRSGGFDYPDAVSVNPTDDSCWVAAWNTVFHLAGDGTQIWSQEVSEVWSLCVNPADNSCWVVTPTEVIHLAEDGTEVWRGGAFQSLRTIAVNPTDGSYWVGDGLTSEVVHLAEDGTELWRGGNFGLVSFLSVNPIDGSCWVACSRATHLAADGTELWPGDGSYGAGGVSVNPADGSCWLASGSIVLHVAEDGTELWRGGGFETATAVSVNPSDGSCWVADSSKGEVTHLVVPGWQPSVFYDVAWYFWAFDEVGACSQAGIVAGYGDGLYHPELAVTRDQMAVYISRALAGGDGNVPGFTGTPTFPDVPTGFWALKYVEYAVSQNVVAGYQDGRYQPGYQVTRDQMAVYIARALVAPSGEAALADYVPADPRNFPDAADTGYGDDGTEPYWAYTHIEYCVENGVVQGYLDGYYHPDEVVTRAQMAVYVARAFGLTS